MQEQDLRIPDEEIIRLRDKIKSKNKSWTSDISARISAEEIWKKYSRNPCKEELVRHISAGRIKSHRHRMLFVKVVSEMLLEIQNAEMEVHELLSQVK